MKLSIITINYNECNGLKKTLDSIRKQTFQDYEQIIIDGGSTDQSIDIIKKFETIANVPFNWISEKDNGVYHAQNKGTVKAKGEYCLFLNSGDYLCNEKVLEIVFSQNLTADIVWGNLIVVDNRGNQTELCKGKADITFFDIYSSIIKHQASFIKRDLFEKIGLYDESLKIVADWAFFFKAVGFNNVAVQYVDVDIACFKADGISYCNPRLCKAERQKVLDRYMPPAMQEDFLLLQKYRGIRNIEKSKIAQLLFRVLAKIFK